MNDAQFRFNQCNSFREEYISVFSPYGPVLILWPVVAAILDFQAFWNIFPIGSNVKLSPAVAAILNFISEQKT